MNKNELLASKFMLFSKYSGIITIISIIVFLPFVNNKTIAFLGERIKRRQYSMDYMQYSQDFQINSYFNSLPPYARQTILEAYGEITTLGELKKCADHIMNSGLY